MLVHEADVTKGGLSLVDVRGEAPEDLHPPVLDGRFPITWHRIADFQLMSLKLLAEAMLHGTPHFTSKAVECFFPGELSPASMFLAKPAMLYVSPSNPGAIRCAAALNQTDPHPMIGWVAALNQTDPHPMIGWVAARVAAPHPSQLRPSLCASSA